MSYTLAKFACTAGVVIVPVSKRDWGGQWGYTSKDYPNVRTCGFATKDEAHKHWAIGTFGECTANALFKLLEPTK